MAEVLRLVRLYAGLPRPVILTGPTGVGKGYCARLLHDWSGVPGPFVELTGGQLAESLMHSQLFGHSADAYTGGRTRARGVFEQAARGTLFLDEIQHWGSLRVHCPAISSKLSCSAMPDARIPALSSIALE